jgi:hypothetical protein
MRPLAFRVGRYSTKDAGDSLDRQNAHTVTLCTANDYDDGGWYGVDDESGNADTRARQGKDSTPPTLRWAMEQIEQAKVTYPDRAVVLVAWKEARLFRDVTEKESLRRFMQRWRDVWWHTFEGTRNPHNAADTMVSTVTAGTNQFYADSVRELIMDKHASRLNDKKVPAGTLGFGHRREVLGKDPKTGADIYGDRWLVEKKEAALLRGAIEGYLNGTPIAAIRDRWIENGVATRNNGTWTITTIKRMFSQPRLAGILFRNGREHGRSDYIEPIIDEPTFRRLQARIAENPKPTRARLGRQLLTGVLFCGKCDSDSVLNSNVKGSQPTTRVYACRKCGGCNINGEAVDHVVTEALFRALEAGGGTKVSTNDRKEAAKITKALEALDLEVNDLARAADGLPVSVLVAKSKSINEEREHLLRRLAVVEEKADARRWYLKATEITRAWASYDNDRKRQIILDVLGRYQVMPGGSGRRATPEQIASRLVPLAR